MFYDIILRLNPIALLAQLDRVSGYGPEGQGFESLTARHRKTRLYESTTLFFLYETLKPPCDKTVTLLFISLELY